MSVIRPGYWDPWDLGDNLYAWWNADDYGSSLMTDDGAGRISLWKDRKHRIALAAATTARPTYGPTAFNSIKKALSHDGVANCMRGTDLSLLPTGSTPFEVWQLVEFTAPIPTTTIRFSFAMGGAATAANKATLRYSAVSTRGFTLSDGVTNSINSLGADIPSGFPKVVGAYFSGTTMGGRYDGRPMSTTPTTIASKATGTDRVVIGASTTNTVSNFFLGVVRQTLITKILSPANRLRMEGWLAWDGGIQSVLP